jgi:hypothetical protein
MGQGRVRGLGRTSFFMENIGRPSRLVLSFLAVERSRGCLRARVKLRLLGLEIFWVKIRPTFAPQSGARACMCRALFSLWQEDWLCNAGDWTFVFC